jgi:hypothetical protein
MRAKLHNGELIYPPNVCARPDGSTVVGYPQREDLLIADGWKAVEDVEQPASGLWAGSWADDGGVIRRVWTPREKTDAEAAYDAQVSEQNAAESAATAARAARLKALRDMYAGATAQLCQLAGLPVVRVLDMADIQTAVMPLLATEQAGLVNGLLTLLTNLEGKLTREDMPDALDRV